MERFAVIRTTDDGTQEIKFYEQESLAHLMVYVRACSLTTVTDGCWLANFPKPFGAGGVDHVVIVWCPS